MQKSFWVSEMHWKYAGSQFQSLPLYQGLLESCLVGLPVATRHVCYSEKVLGCRGSDLPQ